MIYHCLVQYFFYPCGFKGKDTFVVSLYFCCLNSTRYGVLLFFALLLHGFERYLSVQLWCLIGYSMLHWPKHNMLYAISCMIYLLHYVLFYCHGKQILFKGKHNEKVSYNESIRSKRKDRSRLYILCENKQCYRPVKQNGDTALDH